MKVFLVELNYTQYQRQELHVIAKDYGDAEAVTRKRYGHAWGIHSITFLGDATMRDSEESNDG